MFVTRSKCPVIVSKAPSSKQLILGLAVFVTARCVLDVHKKLFCLSIAVVVRASELVLSAD